MIYYSTGTAQKIKDSAASLFTTISSRITRVIIDAWLFLVFLSVGWFFEQTPMTADIENSPYSCILADSFLRIYSQSVYTNARAKLAHLERPSKLRTRTKLKAGRTDFRVPACVRMKFPRTPTHSFKPVVRKKITSRKYLNSPANTL